MGIMTLDEIKPTQLLSKTKIFVNGRFIGIVANPNEVDEKETGIEIDINIPPSCLWVIKN